jgi:hypothetical protein
MHSPLTRTGTNVHLSESVLIKDREHDVLIGYEKKPAELQLLKKNMVVIVFRN